MKKFVRINHMPTKEEERKYAQRRLIPVYLYPENKARVMELMSSTGLSFNEFCWYMLDQDFVDDVLKDRRKELEGTVRGKLCDWLDAVNLARRPNTRKFNGETVHSIGENWPEDISIQRAETISWDQCLEFARRVDWMAPSRWNNLRRALCFVSPHANGLKRKKLRFRNFNPPNKEQINRLLAECDKSYRSHCGLAVRFLLLTGMRIHEARNLRWSHVFEEEGRIEITAEFSKNGRRRSIPFINGMRELLAKLREAGTTDHVLPDPHFRRAIKSACIRAGIEPLSYHCMRHIFITRCVESGIDVPTIARFIGHSDGGALLSRMYFHLLDDHARKMAEKISVF